MAEVRREKQSRSRINFAVSAPRAASSAFRARNRLEAVKDDWAGHHSIRVNDQWRLVFRWQGPDAFEVQIVDYH
jgi:proteic killer suppression protein